MSTSTMAANRLDVSGVCSLQPATHRGARINLPDLAGTDVRSVLDGTQQLERLHGVLGQRGRLGDFISTYWSALFLISETFLRVLKSGLTGWAAVPVLVGDGQPLYLLRISGCAGPVASVPSGRDVGQYLDPDTWDGSDLFLAKNHSRILVTPSAARKLASADLKNLILENAGLLPAGIR